MWNNITNQKKETVCTRTSPVTRWLDQCWGGQPPTPAQFFPPYPLPLLPPIFFPFPLFFSYGTPLPKLRCFSPLTPANFSIEKKTNPRAPYPLSSPTLMVGWELLTQFPLFRYFPNFLALWTHKLAIHVYIWQVSPQLTSGDTWQIWMWLKEFNRYFCKIKHFAYGEINEQSFSDNKSEIASVYQKKNIYTHISVTCNLLRWSDAIHSSYGILTVYLQQKSVLSIVLSVTCLLYNVIHSWHTNGRLPDMNRMVIGQVPDEYRTNGLGTDNHRRVVRWLSVGNF